MWLKEGDANFKFFHACVKSKSEINQILALHGESGWLVDATGIKNMMVSYFSNHSSQSCWNRRHLDGTQFLILSV